MIVLLGGKKYRLLKLPAVRSKELLKAGLSSDLSELRSSIEAQDGAVWIALDSPEAVETYVGSWEVLTALEAASYEYNYGFLRGWKPARVPDAMKATYRVVESAHVDPIVSALVSAGLATYKELRDDYSLEEAFKMLDVLTTKKINEFRASEALK